MDSSSMVFTPVYAAVAIYGLVAGSVVTLMKGE